MGGVWHCAMGFDRLKLTAFVMGVSRFKFKSSEVKFWRLDGLLLKVVMITVYPSFHVRYFLVEGRHGVERVHVQMYVRLTHRRALAYEPVVFHSASATGAT